MKKFIESYIKDSVETKQKLLTNTEMLSIIEKSAKIIAGALKAGGKVLTAGNGGSAADAQHLAAEFVGKFMYERQALCAIALTNNNSIITAIGNDYSNDYIFARQIQAYGKPNDIFIAISTSGNSKNIILAIEEAKKRGLKVIGLTGGSESLMENICDFLIKIPSDKTPIIQESQIMTEHIICNKVIKHLLNFKQKHKRDL